jgi:integral membrane protein
VTHQSVDTRTDLLPAAQRFRYIAVAEAVSWAGLLVGMLFKYVIVENPIGVKVFGPIHGALFVLYLVLAVLAARALRWGVGTVAMALLAGVPPFGTIVFERWATRTGRMRPPADRRG